MPHGVAVLPALLLLLVPFVLAACGPFQVSIEGTAAPLPAAGASPTVGLATQAGAGPTVAALQTENARLADRVATLAAAQAATPEPRPAATLPAPALASPAAPTSAPPTSAPAGPAVRITFSPGSASVTVSPDLIAGQPQAYVLKINAGQHIMLTADHEVQAQVLGPDNRPIPPASTVPRQWDFAVTQTGDQTIVLTGAGHVTVTIYVPPR